ncbi:helix-turn-helix domain-containing protein [Streptomyces sp. NPDC058459]|uniref:helix-turn-helix domain-containing protein n=1 Tax=Streptomyces sp. NPDC058459 TaxID=3346508 RepID=UPI003667F03D
MTSSKPHQDVCVVCSGQLVQNTGVGRRRRYCGTACRRRAQRQRQASRAVTVEQQSPLGSAVAAEVHRLAGQLVDSEVRQEELGTLLERAGAIRRELDIYTAAAVQEARHRGEKWEDVARAAHVAPETTRTRWGPERVARMMVSHANEKGAAPARWRAARSAPIAEAQEAKDAVRPEAVSAMGQLASALTQLQVSSGKTIKEVADRAMLSPSFISRVLSGDRLPTWDLVCSLSGIFESDPAQLRVLFEAAHGMTPAQRQPVTATIQQLHAAVRGLHLAAKEPSAQKIEALSRKAVSAAAVRRVLAGHDVPDWEVLSALVRALDGSPGDVCVNGPMSRPSALRWTWRSRG